MKFHISQTTFTEKFHISQTTFLSGQHGVVIVPCRASEEGKGDCFSLYWGQLDYWGQWGELLIWEPLQPKTANIEAKSNPADLPQGLTSRN